MWYVIQTRIGDENTCRYLCNKRLSTELYQEIFIPKYIEKMHFQRKWHDVTKVLFPGYVFVDTKDIEGVSKELRKIERFARVLKNAGEVVPITYEEEIFLKRMMDSDHIIHCSTGLIIGNRICITDGPLRDYYGFIKKVDRHRRVAKLEIDLFGRMTPVEVGLEILARITEEEFVHLKKENCIKTGEEKNAIESVPNSNDKFCSNKREIKIISGVFAGMSGILLSKREKRDQWRVQINLFDTPTEVVFHKKELEVY